MKKLLIIPIIFIIIVSSFSLGLIGDISDSIVGEFLYDATQGLNPSIITLNNKTSIISYTGNGNDGFVKTINISQTNGSIFNTIDTLEWDTVLGLESRIINVNGVVFAIVSQGSQGDGFIDTINISDSGTITQVVVDSLEFDTSQAMLPDIIKVDSDTVAIAYTGIGNDGFLATIDIDSSGQIGAAVIDSLEFDTTNGMEIDIIKIAPEIYVLAYEGVIATNIGKISTVNITGNGQIGASTINDFNFDSNGLNPEILQIGTTNTFVIAYENSTGNGNLRTVNIFPNGTITAELDRAEFDSSGTDINLISINDNVIGIVYSGDLSDGFVRTFDITDAGIISSSIDVLEFEITDTTNPRVTFIDENIYQVAYENSVSEGLTKTFNISSPILPVILNETNLNVFLSKNPVEILEKFILFANYTNATDNQPVLNATCFANSSIVGGGSAGFGRGVLGIGGLSTLNNAVHTQLNDIFGNNTLRVDIDSIPLGKASYAINFRFHAHNQTPADDLRIYATCHDNLTFSNFTLFGQVNSTEAVMSTSTGNDTIWGFKNIVLFGAQVATPNCSFVFESQNTSIDKHWMIADTTTNLNLNNSFTSNDFGETYTLRSNADTRSPFVDAGFGLDVPDETTMTFNSTSGFYFLDNIRHGRPFDFIDRVFCSADNFVNATDFVITNVQDNVAPIVQITLVQPKLAVLGVDNVTINWISNDPELLTDLINISFPNGTLLLETTEKIIILTPTNLTVIGNYSIVAFANDTGGLSSTANDTFEVRLVDVTPPVITLITPANNTATNVIPLNITLSVTDDFPNDILCILSNSTITFDSGTFPQSTNFNLILAKGEIALDQEFPDLKVTCFDNTVPNNNSAIILLNYTLDTIPPIIFTISPANEQKFNKDITSSINIKANCTDAPVFRLNITIENATNRIASFESRSPVNNFIVIDENLNIATLGVGNYTINYTCADTHTKIIIADYNIRKNISDRTIKYVTPDRNEFKIRYLQNSLDLADFGSEKAESKDRYKFWFNSNETETKTRRTFIFEIISKKPVYYIENSNYKGHFITGNNWIDFEFNDKDAAYKVTRNTRNNYEVEITTAKTNLNFNSVGDLNLASTTTTFEIFFTEQIEDLFQITVCRTDTGSSLLLGLFMLISLFLITLGITTNIGFIGFFGSLALLFTSLRIIPCIAALATILIFLSLLLLFHFIFRGFYPKLN